jgi:hypothetical protein
METSVTASVTSQIPHSHVSRSRTALGKDDDTHARDYGFPSIFILGEYRERCARNERAAGLSATAEIRV